jgi:branched-chain amino acid transport system ATP-binding protein
VTVTLAGIIGIAMRIYFDSTRGLVALAARDNEIRVEYLGSSVRGLIAGNFVIAAFCGGLGGALAVMALGHVEPEFSFWTRSGDFVFVAILAGHHSVLAAFIASTVLEIVRSFSSAYFPNSWQLVLGLFLLAVIRFLPNMTAPRSAIVARGVQKNFGAVTAAADIHLDIPQGQRVSLIGSNGAGKTTFVNMLTGYIQPDSGQILLDGDDIVGLEPRQIARMGVARSFQIPQLYKELSVLDNMLAAIASQQGALSFWRPAKNTAAIERAQSMLDRFELAAHEDRLVGELPGGVRKLLDIAMALTRQPKVLLLDEPTSGVSADEKFPMMDTVMRALNQENVTVLFVEHDMDIVERYADRVIAFYSGRIIADDVPEKALAMGDVKRYVTGDFSKAQDHA